MNGASVKVYSRAVDGLSKVAENFTVREFACSDGSDAVFIAPELASVLQKVRTHFAKSVHVLSGYRTPTHNAKVGGSKSSQHLLGRAADIQVAGTSVEDVASYAESLLHNWGGVGRYPVKAGRAKGWVHVDTRPNKRRWTQ